MSVGRSHTAKRWGRLHLRRASDSREKMLWWDQHQGYEAGCSALGLGSICLTPLFPGVVGRINRL